MKNLVLKDLTLAVHPITIIYFILAGSMMFIPNYPRFIGFFYILIAVFVTFVTDLQYKDREFCGILPVSKRQVVQARTLTVMILELGVLIISIPCAILGRQVLGNMDIEHEAGLMEANITVFSAALFAYGLSNLIIIKGGYRKRFQVKVRAIVAMFVFMAVCGVTEGIVDTLKLDWLASASAADLIKQIPILLVALALYIILSWLACELAVKDYEKSEI